MANFQAESLQLSALCYDDSTSSGSKKFKPSKLECNSTSSGPQNSDQNELEYDSGKRTKTYYGMVLIINIAKGNKMINKLLNFRFSFNMM